MTTAAWAWLVLLFPLLGSMVIAFGFRRLPARTAGIIGTAAIGLAFLAGIGSLFALLSEPSERGQGFEDQHARHHRAAREMAHEIGLVERDVLDRLDACIALKLRDLVHQQEGVAVGQLLENCVNIHHCVPLWP